MLRFVLINSTRKWPDWLVWEVLGYIWNDFIEAGTLSRAAGHCWISTTCQCQFTGESPTLLPALAALCNVCDSEMQSQCSLWTGSLQRKREVSIGLDRPNDNPSGFEKPKICALVNQTWAEMEVSCLTKFSSFGWNYFVFLVSAGRDCNFECKPSQSVVTLNPTVANCYWWVGVNMDVGSMPLVEL